MKSFILVSVLCTVAFARPDGYHHGRDSENKVHLTGNQQNSWSAPLVSNEHGHQQSSNSYAPAVSHTHAVPSASKGTYGSFNILHNCLMFWSILFIKVQHQQPHAHHVVPAAHSTQYIFHPAAPAQSHYHSTVHSHHKAPAEAHYHGHVGQHYDASSSAHYKTQSQSQSESNHGIVDSIVNSGHFEPSYNEIVHKHVSVHEPQQEREQSYIPIIQPQPAQKNKHYKLIFVKSPSAQPKAPVIHVPNVQNEEKTLVYVLNKNPGQVPDVVLPEPKPTKVNKPEVFYVNYEDKKKEQTHEVHSHEVHSHEIVTVAPEIPIHEEVHDIPQPKRPVYDFQYQEEQQQQQHHQ